MITVYETPSQEQKEQAEKYNKIFDEEGAAGITNAIYNTIKPADLRKLDEIAATLQNNPADLHIKDIRFLLRFANNAVRESLKLKTKVTQLGEQLALTLLQGQQNRINFRHHG